MVVPPEGIIQREKNLISPTVVHTSLRTIFHGIQHSTLSNQGAEIHQFRGIKYGSIPGRFQRSTVFNAYPSDTDATKHGPIAPQEKPPDVGLSYNDNVQIPLQKPAFSQPIQDEFNCLNLTITRPGRTKRLLPVMVWIHGGQNISGSGSDWITDAGALVKKSMQMRRPVMIVSINYRLGLLGFASSPLFKPEEELSPIPRQEPEAAGNFGLWDQHTALLWIHSYITEFGGDPDHVTLFGAGSGAVNIHCHLLSKWNLDASEAYFAASGRSPSPLPTPSTEDAPSVPDNLSPSPSPIPRSPSPSSSAPPLLFRHAILQSGILTPTSYSVYPSPGHAGSTITRLISSPLFSLRSLPESIRQNRNDTELIRDPAAVPVSKWVEATETYAATIKPVDDGAWFAKEWKDILKGVPEGSDNIPRRFVQDVIIGDHTPPAPQSRRDTKAITTSKTKPPTSSANNKTLPVSPLSYWTPSTASRRVRAIALNIHKADNLLRAYDIDEIDSSTSSGYGFTSHYDYDGYGVYGGPGSGEVIAEPAYPKLHLSAYEMENMLPKGAEARSLTSSRASTELDTEVATGVVSASPERRRSMALDADLSKAYEQANIAGALGEHLSTSRSQQSISSSSNDFDISMGTDEESDFERQNKEQQRDPAQLMREQVEAEEGWMTRLGELVSDAALAWPLEKVVRGMSETLKANEDAEVKKEKEREKEREGMVASRDFARETEKDSDIGIAVDSGDEDQMVLQIKRGKQLQQQLKDVQYPHHPFFGIQQQQHHQHQHQHQHLGHGLHPYNHHHGSHHSGHGNGHHHHHHHHHKKPKLFRYIFDQPSYVNFTPPSKGSLAPTSATYQATLAHLTPDILYLFSNLPFPPTLTLPSLDDIAKNTEFNSQWVRDEEDGWDDTFLMGNWDRVRVRDVMQERWILFVSGGAPWAEWVPPPTAEEIEAAEAEAGTNATPSGMATPISSYASSRSSSFSGNALQKAVFAMSPITSTQVQNTIASNGRSTHSPPTSACTTPSLSFSPSFSQQLHRSLSSSSINSLSSPTQGGRLLKSLKHRSKTYIFGPEGETGERSSQIFNCRRRVDTWQDVFEPMGMETVQKIGMEIARGPGGGVRR